jgi:glycosyltransferase involved in cell wall biosynthesis
MRILFLSAWFPHPPSNGSRLRVNALLRALASRHEVALLSFADEPGVDPAAPQLAALCRSVEVLPRPSFDPAARFNPLAFLDPRPRSLVATYSPAMAGAVRRAALSADVVVASQLACATYAPCFNGMPALFEEVELGALRGQLDETAGLQRWRVRLMWTKHRRYLRRLLGRFRACTVVSEVERRHLAGLLGGSASIHVLPNGVALRDYSATAATPEPDTLIFTGSLRYRPNYDAMRWFITSAWPAVRRARPAARLIITGAHDELPLPAAGNVERAGFVDDVRPLIASAWLSIAPILAGGGTRLKILESMAAGTPVVATSKGAEGLDAFPGEHLLIADDPAAFAAHVVALLSDPTLRARLARAARALVEAHHDWRTLGPRFATLVESLA